jgi:flagellar basal-body rod modification protein FlgD
MTTAVSANDPYAALNRRSSTTSTAASAQDTEDRFLKLLVTQMQNQDPLNPMDNAAVTTQMSQISTVSGIEKLNRSIESMSSQFVQLQALQSASLVGRDVVVPGNAMSVREGVGRGGFELATNADSVRVEVLSASGTVVTTLDQGARKAGVHSFDWTVPSGVDPAGLSFRIVAQSGAAAVTSTALMRDRVDAVRTGGDELMLELRSKGSVPYTGIKAFA